MGAVEAVPRDEFEKWLDERPQWLQTAAAKIIAEHRKPTPAEIASLADLCVAEAKNIAGTVFEKVPAGVLGSKGASNAAKLLKIEQVQGVNAIKSGAKLDFGQSNLVIVYGMNGAGKSGFSRLLKNVCGARSRQDIHPDVFATGAPAISAEVTALLDEKVHTFGWTATAGPIGPLRNVQVFDNLTANNYVNSKSEASYEPRRMRFLATMIEVVDQVAAELTRRKSALPSNMPVVPVEYFGTVAQTFVKNIKHSVLPAAIDEACRWTADDDAQRLAVEVSLKQKDIQGRLKELNAASNRLKLLKQSYSNFKEALSDGKVAEIVLARASAIAARKAASVDAEKVFANAELDGVGQESWKLMWKEARAYSEEFAYKDKPFPVVDAGSKCVLCQQPLDDAAKVRLADFEGFVKGGLETAAKQAEKALSPLLGQLPELPNHEQWAVDLQFLSVDRALGEGLYKSLAARLDGIKAGAQMEQLPVLDWAPVEVAILAIEAGNAKEEAALAELQKDGQRQVLEKQLKELKARAWVAEQRAAIDAEVARLKGLAAIEAAEKLAKTNALSLKKNELAREELANGYRDRFAQELEILGGSRIPVSPVQVAEAKGKTSFQLTLKGAKHNVAAHAVLSEGECRIVALSAFIADMLGSSHLTPFVFDDPITSLDIEFEERVVDRLVELSRSRQVIVFTHRLSLLSLLEDAIKKVNEYAAARGGQMLEPTVISLRRFGSAAGITEELTARNKKPASGFNVLLKESIPRINKYLENQQVAEYEFALKAACSDFRILVERCIEQQLLSDVVGRFRRAVNTLKLRNLPKIRTDDCAFLDELMTRYSRYEHSQSMELGGSLPKPDELAADITKISGWIQEFDKRQVA